MTAIAEQFATQIPHMCYAAWVLCSKCAIQVTSDFI